MRFHINDRNAFQIYEFARQALIKDLRSARDDMVSSACGALGEVLTSWQTAYSEGLNK